MAYVSLRFPNFKRKALTLSYDDDVIFNKRLIEIFNKYGLKATFNLNSEHFTAEDGSWMISEKTMVDLLKNSSHEIAVHGAQHLSMSEVDDAVAVNDLITDRKNFESIFGKVIKGMAYANGTGAMNDRSVELVKACGINYARTTVSTHGFGVPTDWLRMPATCHHADPKLMELAKKFIESKEEKYYWANKPLLFYVWGHAYEFEQQNNWEVIENFAQYISGKEDIWYATNGEIYDYVWAYNQLEYSVDGKIIHNPTATDVYIKPRGYGDTLVKAGETVILE